MDRALKHISYVMIFLVFFCIICDMGKLREKKESIKDALDLSTKAAALQIDTDPTKISQGIFNIEPVAAKSAFESLMALNLNTDTTSIDAGIIDWQVINTPRIYTNSITHATYYISNPTIVATVKFHYQGLLYKKDIIVQNNVAGSELKSTKKP
jgi:hypothetical protein